MENDAFGSWSGGSRAMGDDYARAEKLLELSGNGRNLLVLQEIAEAIQKTRDTARRWVSELVDLGLIVRKNVTDPAGRGTAQRLRLTAGPEMTARLAAKTSTAFSIGVASYLDDRDVLEGATGANSKAMPPPYYYLFYRTQPMTTVVEVCPRSGTAATPIAELTSETDLDGLEKLFETIDAIQDSTPPPPPVDRKHLIAAVPQQPRVKMIHPPDPPKLTGSALHDRQLLELAFRSARNKRYPVKRGLPVATYNGFAKFAAEASQRMRAADVLEPHLWAMFRLAWTPNETSIRNVFRSSLFDDARLVEIYGSFARRVRVSFVGHTQSHGELVRRWLKARQLVFALPGTATLEQAQAAVASIYTTELRDRLMKSGDSEARVLRRRFEDMAAEGEWMWGDTGGRFGE